MAKLTKPAADRIANYYMQQNAIELYKEAKRLSDLTLYMSCIQYDANNPTKILLSINEAIRDCFGHDILTLPKTLNDQKGLERSDQLHAGLKKEKIVARAPKLGLVHVKGKRGSAVYLKGSALNVLIWGAYLPYKMIDIKAHTSIVVVENWQAFERIDDCRIELGPVGKRPLFVYRGDNKVVSSAYIDLCLMAKQNIKDMPIVGYFDIDPAGVFMADAIPSITHFTLPPIEQIPNKISSHDCFIKQLSATNINGWKPKSVACQKAWAVIIKNKFAIPQEVFIKQKQ